MNLLWGPSRPQRRGPFQFTQVFGHWNSCQVTCVKCLKVNSAWGGWDTKETAHLTAFLADFRTSKYSSHPYPYGQNCLSLRAFWLKGESDGVWKSSYYSAPVRQPPNPSSSLGAGAFIMKRIWHLLLPLNFLLLKKILKIDFELCSFHTMLLLHNVS